MLRCRSAKLFPSAAWFPGRIGPNGTSFRCSRIMKAPGPMSPTLLSYPHPDTHVRDRETWRRCVDKMVG